MAASPHHRTMFEDGDIRALPHLRLPYRATLASNAASHITYMDYSPKTSTLYSPNVLEKLFGKS